MKVPTKVVIEITADHYTESVFVGDDMVASRKSIMGGPGSSKAEKGGGWRDYEDAISPQLVEALEDEIGFGPFSVAGVLWHLREEFQ